MSLARLPLPYPLCNRPNPDTHTPTTDIPLVTQSFWKCMLTAHIRLLNIKPMQVQIHIRLPKEIRDGVARALTFLDLSRMLSFFFAFIWASMASNPLLALPCETLRGMDMSKNDNITRKGQYHHISWQCLWTMSHTICCAQERWYHEPMIVDQEL